MAKIYENNLNVNVRNTFCKADFVPQSFPYFMGAAHHIILKVHTIECPRLQDFKLNEIIFYDKKHKLICIYFQYGPFLLKES